MSVTTIVTRLYCTFLCCGLLIVAFGDCVPQHGFADDWHLAYGLDVIHIPVRANDIVCAAHG